MRFPSHLEKAETSSTYVPSSDSFTYRQNVEFVFDLNTRPLIELEARQHALTNANGFRHCAALQLLQRSYTRRGTLLSGDER